MKPWIQTRTGKAAWPLAMQPEMVSIVDIATALGNLCRYTGHTRRFYSVAEHSVHVSRLVLPRYALAGLLHDAAEAYLGDCSAPLKAKSSFAIDGYFVPFAEVERCVHAAICAHLEVSPEIPASVKRADITMLHTERKALLGLAPLPWNVPGEGDDSLILHCWSPDQARLEFMTRFVQLTGVFDPMPPLDCRPHSRLPAGEQP